MRPRGGKFTGGTWRQHCRGRAPHLRSCLKICRERAVNKKLPCILKKMSISLAEADMHRILEHKSIWNPEKNKSGHTWPFLPVSPGVHILGPTPHLSAVILILLLGGCVCMHHEHVSNAGKIRAHQGNTSSQLLFGCFSWKNILTHRRKSTKSSEKKAYGEPQPWDTCRIIHQQWQLICHFKTELTPNLPVLLKAKTTCL